MTIARAAALAPVVIGAAAWFRHLDTSSFATPPIWFTKPWERLTYPWFTDAAFGGLRGPVEFIVLGALLAWVLAGVWQARRELRASVDVPLLVCASIFLGAAILLPTKYENTIQFDTRWVAPAFVLILLGAPSPRFPRPTLALAAPLALVGVFTLSTALAWSAFETRDLSGLRESLDALPPGQRVLGLEYLIESPIVKGRPFIQTFAYAQVVKGASLNFSFAQFVPMPVIYARPPQQPWTSALEWRADWVKASDFQYFDYVIVGGDEEAQQAYSMTPLLEPVTVSGKWRLYAVRRPPGSDGSPVR